MPLEKHLFITIFFVLDLLRNRKNLMPFKPVPVSDRRVYNDNSLAGLIDDLFDKFLLENIDDTLPAQIVSFDAVTNRVSVKPLIKMVRTDGVQIERTEILSIPVFSLGSNKMAIRFNLEAGDLGWIKASDNDISLFLQNYEDSAPNTARTHSFSDAIFYPDHMRGYNFSENMIISNPDQTIKIGFFDDRIEITAPTVNVDASTVNINSTNTNIGVGGQPIARFGDTVEVLGVQPGISVRTGTITGFFK